MLILRRTFLPPGRLRFASWQPEEANSLVIGGSSPWRRGTISTWSWKPTLSLTAETEDPFSSLLCPAILTIASQQTRNQVLSSGHGWAMMTGKKREDAAGRVAEGGRWEVISISMGATTPLSSHLNIVARKERVAHIARGDFRESQRALLYHSQ